jgi:hypothetical protein
MSIMRATSALCLLLLSGCAAGMQQPVQTTVSLRPRAPSANGALKQAAPAVDKKRVAAVVLGREACQTNDPMPTGQFQQPVPPMPHTRPLHLAPMPNACPVTMPMTGKSVLISTPQPSKIVPVPLPTEPAP